MSTSRFPDALALLTGGILLAALLTHVVPSGRFDRVHDADTDRDVVVAGSYAEVEPAPVGLFEAMVAVPRGLADAGEVVFLVFLIGGAFTVVDRTGALRWGVDWLLVRLSGRETLLIPLVSLAFAAGGALENMQEEIIALVPVLLILTRRVGFTPLVAVSMSAGSAFVASAFSPINPFQVGIAQRLAQLPLLSGAAFRIAFLVLALGFWIASTMRYAVANRGEPVHEELPVGESVEGRRHGAVIGTVGVTVAVLVWGLLARGWGFNQMSALFLMMGIVAGFLAGLGVNGTARAYAQGFREMAYAALLIGFARAIFVVLEDGRIVDTLVNAMFAPTEHLPVAISALAMVASHTALHVPVPSVSGHAVLTMPVLVPLSDLLGMSRQVTVLAYQYGAGLCDLLTPTNGALMAILAAGGVGYESWIKFCVPRYLALLGLGAVSILIALGMGLQ